MRRINIEHLVGLRKMPALDPEAPLECLPTTETVFELPDTKSKVRFYDFGIGGVEAGSVRVTLSRGIYKEEKGWSHAGFYHPGSEEYFVTVDSSCLIDRGLGLPNPGAIKRAIISAEKTARTKCSDYAPLVLENLPFYLDGLRI